MIVFVGDQTFGKLAFVWSPTKTIISFLRSKTSPRDGRVVPSRLVLGRFRLETNESNTNLLASGRRRCVARRSKKITNQIWFADGRFLSTAAGTSNPVLGRFIGERCQFGDSTGNRVATTADDGSDIALPAVANFQGFHRHVSTAFFF